MTSAPPRLLTIAGSDPSGGAGIQADIKTATALGAYAMTAITAVTVQNTMGVTAIHRIPPAVVCAQILACLEDIGADAIKIGMLGSAAIAGAVADALREHAADIPLVVDPVIAATGGTALLDKNGVEILRTRLIPMATLITPNIPEAAALAGFECVLPNDMLRAGRALLAMGAKAVLITGGHGTGDVLTDTLVTRQGHQTFTAARIDTPHTHGTGCTYSAAIAVGLAGHRTLEDAVARAHAFVQAAIAGAPGFGRGHGPLDHMHAMDRNK